ncbi:hypothetical protein ILUMI_23818 [Ignelater luminosus]|uniref:DUF5641 domain-containing protein n=1 Tax=Ignelater luminosus TaxID=2038154 RepID=A0A8K0G194_IGNLU|nr:hypothetical protein ILUMI_23818 [Ignelater luminosus]
MLIGCDLFFELLLDGQIRLGKDMPSMQNTLLGWIVSGSISRVQNNNNSSVNAMPTSCLFTCETPIDVELQKSWAMEEIVPSRDTFLTKEELACEAHFAKTITQTSTGRFVVKLPLKPTYTQLATAEEVAISRLLAKERKFLKDSNMKTEYTAFMSEYETTPCLYQIALENAEQFRIECQVIRSDFYVDNLLTGSSNLQDLINLKNNICKLLQNYGFGLRKLQSNDDSERLTDSMSSDDLQYTITDSASIKTLGVSWIPSTDQFECNAHNMHAYENVKATKRSILSFIAKIFDPLVKAAKIALVKIAQIQAFPNELCCLQQNQEVGPSSSLKSLAPFLDSSGIMRVGGRRIHSNLSYDQKHQIIIPYSHALTTLIISYEHRRSLHAGAQTTLSFVRQKYWPIRGKQYLRQQFWAKWSFDYLHNLQQRTKWQFSHNADLTIGAIVLLKEDNIPPMHWRLGRITAIHPGKDGVVRVVSVRTKTGVTKRGLSKACLLPTEKVQISDK